MSDLIPKHGGYRNLKGFQVAQLVYDITVRFCDRYVSKFSRTQDQMVQAARSGVQNIAEGSQASATSKKTELKLTQVARASLEELKLDYEDFLRQRDLTMLTPDHPALFRLKSLKPQTVEEFATWVSDERKRCFLDQKQDQTDSDNPCLSSACFSANGVLTLLNLSCYLLDCQVERLATDFENEGGFSERLYKVRSEKRRENGEERR